MRGMLMSTVVAVIILAAGVNARTGVAQASPSFRMAMCHP